MMEDKQLKKYILLTSIALFLISLTQKCYCTTSHCGDSIMVLLLGWAALSSGIAGIIWMANPLLFLSWWLLKKKLKVSMFLSVFAALLALSFLLIDEMVDTEAGHRRKVIGYRAGYWLWLGSHLCMLLGTFLLVLRHNTRIKMKSQ